MAEIRVRRSVDGKRSHLRTIDGAPTEPADVGTEVEEFERSGRSPYPAVNERRRKRAWNRRSTAQLARQRRENPDSERKRAARLAYKAWLRANAAEILAQAKSGRAA